MKRGASVEGLMQRVASARPNYLQYLAEADFAQSESVVWHLRVAEGDHLSERSEGEKLPKHRTRALDVLRKLKTFLGGASGGMQGGPRRGRSPITGPALPYAAQASQLRRMAKLHARRAETQKQSSPLMKLKHAPRANTPPRSPYNSSSAQSAGVSSPRLLIRAMFSL